MIKSFEWRGELDGLRNGGKSSGIGVFWRLHGVQRLSRVRAATDVLVGVALIRGCSAHLWHGYC